MSESLLEYAALHDRTARSLTVRIDRESHRLRGVKILGFTSTNGRTYELEAVRRALRLYEGARVNVNHPAAAVPGPRDYHDRLGSLVDVRLDEGQGLFGDLFYNPKHPLAEQLLWDAEHAPHNVGLSHNVLARTARRGDTTVVNEIVAVVSVDLVADPATTRGLFEGEESATSEAEPSPDAAGVSENLSLSNSHADSTSSALEETRTPELQAEIGALREQLAAALRREAGVREELERHKESSLRNVAQTPRSREQAAESLKRGPEPTRAQSLQAFVAALRGK